MFSSQISTSPPNPPTFPQPPSISKSQFPNPQNSQQFPQQNNLYRTTSIHEQLSMMIIQEKEMIGQLTKVISQIQYFVKSLPSTGHLGEQKIILYKIVQVKAVLRELPFGGGGQACRGGDLFMKRRIQKLELENAELHTKIQTIQSKASILEQKLSKLYKQSKTKQSLLLHSPPPIPIPLLHKPRPHTNLHNSPRHNNHRHHHYISPLNSLNPPFLHQSPQRNIHIPMNHLNSPRISSPVLVRSKSKSQINQEEEANFFKRRRVYTEDNWMNAVDCLQSQIYGFRREREREQNTIDRIKGKFVGIQMVESKSQEQLFRANSHNNMFLKNKSPHHASPLTARTYENNSLRTERSWTCHSDQQPQRPDFYQSLPNPNIGSQCSIDNNLDPKPNPNLHQNPQNPQNPHNPHNPQQGAGILSLKESDELKTSGYFKQPEEIPSETPADQNNVIKNLQIKTVTEVQCRTCQTLA